MAIALQLYTVRRELAHDFPETMRRLREIGYTAVETYPFPGNVSTAEAAELFHSLGMKVVSMHRELPLGSAWAEVREAAGLLGCKRIVWHGWPRSTEHDSIEGVRRLATRYNEALAAARDSGLQFGLHNHWWEFERIDRLYPYQVFNELLHPEVFWEIDTYWAKTAGFDPAEIIIELASRVQLLHLKDGPAVHGSPMTRLVKAFSISERF